MTDEVKPRSCEDCKYGIFADYGYSNYTTEGTEFSCAVKAHPEGSFDRWYGEEVKLLFAGECPRFVEGDAIFMDCDREEESNLTPEQKLIWEGAFDEDTDV